MVDARQVNIDMLSGILTMLRECDSAVPGAVLDVGTNVLTAIGGWKWHQPSNNLYDHMGARQVSGAYPRNRRPNAPTELNPAANSDAATALAQRLLPDAGVATITYTNGMTSAGVGSPPRISAEEFDRPAIAILVALVGRLHANWGARA